MTAAAGRNDWRAQLAYRLRSHWPLKMVGTTAAITGFMMIYFALLQHPQFPVIEVPWTPVDHWIAFNPWGIIPYGSLWLYIPLVPALLLLREALPYISAVVLISLIGWTIFLFWPTTVVQPDINWALYPSVGFLKTVAPSGNACPSMHVAFSVLTALWLHRLLKRLACPTPLRWLNLGWCALILWSTLALKQHLLLDLLAGSALALAVGVPHLYFWPQRDTHMTQALPDSE